MIAAKGKLGDRSLRDDDRFLFLETVMSAEERLILLYQGQSAKDNSPRPASVCLDELLEYTDHAFTTRDGKRPRDLLVRKHRLHNTSSAYYDQHDERLFSYSLENALAAQNHQEQPLEPFFPNRPKTHVCARIAPPPPPGETITIEDLTNFWQNPAKFLCRSALGFTLPWEEEKTPDCEIFALGTLDEYTLKNELVSRFYKLGSLPPPLPELERARLAGWLPVGRQGEAVFHKCFSEACQLAEAALAFGEPAGEVIETTVLDRKISGSLEQLTPGGCLFFRSGSEPKPKDLLRAWITHLGLNIKRLEMNQPGVSTISLHLKEMATFPPLTDLAWAHRAFAPLIKGYLVGSCRPLPFFPETSYKLCKKTTPDQLETTAGEAWSGKSFQGIKGDRDDQHVQLCFRGRNPLTDYPLNRKLILWARAIWLPLLEVKK